MQYRIQPEDSKNLENLCTKDNKPWMCEMFRTSGCTALKRERRLKWKSLSVSTVRHPEIMVKAVSVKESVC